MRYILKKYNGSKTRFNCPKCNGKKTFTKYIDIELNEYLGDHVGRCNKIDKCEYHFKPKQFFEDNKDFRAIYKPQLLKVIKPQKPMFTIPIEQLDATLTKYYNNNFALILLKLFGYIMELKGLNVVKLITIKFTIMLKLILKNIG